MKLIEHRGKYYRAVPEVRGCIDCELTERQAREARSEMCSRKQVEVFKDESYCAKEGIIFVQHDPLHGDLIKLKELVDADNRRQI